MVDLAAELAQQAQDERTSAALLSAALEGEPVGVAVLSPVDDGSDFVHVYANPAYHELVPVSAVLGRPFSQVQPEFVGISMERLRRVLATGEMLTVREQPLEVEVAESFLVTRYLTLVVRRLDLSDGLYLLISATDVTAELAARKALERQRGALQESVDRFRSVLENSLDAAYRRDFRTDSYDYLSPVIEQITGYSPEEFAELPVDEVLARIHPDDLSQVQDSIRAGLETGQLTIEYRLLRKDGQYVWLGDYSVIVRDAAGEPAYRSGVVRDISLRKQIEEQLRETLDVQREAARYSEALNEVDAEVSSTLDVDHIMRVVLDRISDTVGADVGVIYVPTQGAWQARYAWHAPPWLDGARVQSENIPYSAHATREHRAMLFSDAASHRGWEKSMARRLGAKQVLDAPLMFGSDEAGDMTLYKIHDADFDDADRDFLQKASTAVSLALQNARRYAREREISDTLQEALLTLPDEVPGLEIARAYRSAAEAARVGGDFYDIFRMSDVLVGIVVGDVAGKGLEASVLTSLAKNVIRAHATEKGAVPGHVLALANELVFAETRGESFITIFLGVLDIGSGRMVYASAGHTTGVVVDAKGTTAPLPSTGPLLGAFSGVSFDDAVQHVEVGESLFLYTDGLTEARRGSELFGEQRVFDLLARRKDATPVDTVRETLDEALRFAGGHLTDDLAVLCVRRLASIDEAPRTAMVAV